MQGKCKTIWYYYIINKKNIIYFYIIFHNLTQINFISENNTVDLNPFYTNKLDPRHFICTKFILHWKQFILKSIFNKPDTRLVHFSLPLKTLAGFMPKLQEKAPVYHQIKKYMYIWLLLREGYKFVIYNVWIFHHFSIKLGGTFFSLVKLS